MDHKVDRAIVRAFFHISFLVDWNENPSAPVLGPLFAPPYLITQLPQQGDPSSPEDFYSSIGVSSIPGDLSLGSALSVVCTSSQVIYGSLMFMGSCPLMV